MKNTFAILLGFLVGIAVGIVSGRHGGRIAPGTEIITKTDTSYVHDTIDRPYPVPVKISTIDTLYLPISTKTDTLSIPDNAYLAGDGKLDTLDNAYLALPIERKVYEEDSLYRAVVSGYNASLDSIKVWSKTVYINTEKTIIAPQRKWSFGATAGPSALLTPSGRMYGGVGVSVGLTYRF